MRKGEIAPDLAEDVKSLIIDWELLFHFKRKNLIFREYPVFTDYNRKVIKFMKEADKDFEKTMIGVVGRFSRAKKIEHILTNVLFLPYSIMTFENEEVYKGWLNIVNPVIHLADIKRRYYHTNSKYFSDLDL